MPVRQFVQLILSASLKDTNQEFSLSVFFFLALSLSLALKNKAAHSKTNLLQRAELFISLSAFADCQAELKPEEPDLFPVIKLISLVEQKSFQSWHFALNSSFKKKTKKKKTASTCANLSSGSLLLSRALLSGHCFSSSRRDKSISSTCSVKQVERKSVFS